MTSYGPALIPPRPQMPTRDDDFRARHQVARAQILRENFDDVLSAWLTNYVRAEVLDTWGQPDTSNVPLVSYCRQLTTPGRYYKRPSLSHPSAGAEGLIAPGGKMDQAGIFSKLQTVEYLTTGLGDYFVRIDHSDRGLHYRLIDPANVYLEKDPDSGETVLWWELRARYLPDECRYVWTFDAFYLGDKYTGRRRSGDVGSTRGRGLPVPVQGERGAVPPGRPVYQPRRWSAVALDRPARSAPGHVASLQLCHLHRARSARRYRLARSRLWVGATSGGH